MRSCTRLSRKSWVRHRRQLRPTPPSVISLILFQPNNPPGATGDYIALAQVNNPPLTGPFSVVFVFKGMGTPGAQPFVVEQFDQNGNFVPCVGSACVSGTPAPITGPAI